MSNKSEFSGDVGQAVIGSVNEAPRNSNSNVVNLTIGGKSEFRPLTTMQRQDITEKVKELVARGDSTSLKIYRVLLNHFGAGNMDSFPGDKYREAMTLLDARLAPIPKAPPVTAPIPSVVPTAPDRAPPTPCRECAQYAARLKRTRLMMLVQFTVLLIAAAFCGWLYWSLSADADAAPRQVAAVSDTRCFIDGRAHSIGSSTKMANGALRECLADATGGAPIWGALQTRKGH